MTDIMCSLPMQIGIKIKIDDETGTAVGWEILDHSVEEVNSFLRQIETQLIGAAKAAKDGEVNEDGHGIFMIDENGEVKSLEDIKETIMDELMSDPDTPETKH